MRIPDEEVQDVWKSLLSEELRRTRRWDAAFQRKGAARPFAYPYVILEVLQYEPAGLAGRPPDRDEFWGLARQLTGVDIPTIKRQGLNKDNRTIASDWAVTDIHLDDPNMGYRIALEGDVPNVGTVTGVLVGRSSRRSLIQAAFYERKADWPQSRGDCQTLLGSFSLQPAFAHPATRLARLPQKHTDQVSSSGPPETTTGTPQNSEPSTLPANMQRPSQISNTPLADTQEIGITPSDSAASTRRNADAGDFMPQMKHFLLKGHPKAEGLDISLDYPASWNAEEGVRPHIVQKFTGHIEGDIFPSCTVTVQSMPPWIGFLLQGETAGEAMVQNIKELLPDGALLIDGGQTRLDGEPCVWLEYSYELERAGSRCRMYMLQYMVFYRGRMIVLNCGIMGFTHHDEALKDAFASHQPIFQMIANSFIINEKWAGDAAASFNGLMEDVLGPCWRLALLLISILTLGMGLLVPLVVRLLLLRRPIAKGSAVLYTVNFVIFNAPLVFFTGCDRLIETWGALLVTGFVPYGILRRGTDKYEREWAKRKGKDALPSQEGESAAALGRLLCEEGQKRPLTNPDERYMPPEMRTTPIGGTPVTSYVQHELERLTDRQHKSATPSAPTTPEPTFSEHSPAGAEAKIRASTSHEFPIEEMSTPMASNDAESVHRNRAIMIALAIFVCAAEGFIYAVIGALLGWRHGGGIIPMMILFGIWAKTWRVITKHASSQGQ